MSNTLGTLIRLTLFGESHGPCVGAVVDGLPAGLAVDEAYIDAMMNQRRAVGALSTKRHEADIPRFVSGVKDGFTTGAPMTVIIENNDVRSGDYDVLKNVARPGHADWPSRARYGNFYDWRGGGHFSGRLTAPIVAAAAVVRQALERQGVLIGSHIASIAEIQDIAFDFNPVEQIKALNATDFAVLDAQASQRMQAAVRAAADEGDSVGGILETAVCGLAAGLGEPWFDSVEGALARALFSIGGVKGVEFGAGFELARMKGSQANDPLRVVDSRVTALTNNAGGINGGLTNGMPVVFRTVIKPTSSVSKPQETVDFSTMENTGLQLDGRHDPAIIHRARVVVDSITALVIADLIAQRRGADALFGGDL